MTLSNFIKANKAEIDEAIHRCRDFVPRTASCNCYKSGTDHIHVKDTSLNDSERRQWILNDEGLYHWAKSEGVKI